MTTRPTHPHAHLNTHAGSAAHRSRRLPPSLARYFWDCDCSKISVATHAAFITERVLQYGNLQAVRWLLAHMPRGVIDEVITHSRRLDAKTRNYWRLMGYGA